MITNYITHNFFNFLLFIIKSENFMLSIEIITFTFIIIMDKKSNIK